MTAEGLGKLIGVSRGTINAIEQGRIRKPRAEMFVELAERNGMTAARLREFYDAWLAEFDAHADGAPERLSQELTPKARAVLALAPEVIPRYGSFTAWRRDVYPNVAGFASLLLISATTLRRFEQGDIPMPKPIIRALTQRLNLSPEYVDALMKLEGTDPEDATRTYHRNAKRIQREREREREVVVGDHDD